MASVLAKLLSRIYTKKVPFSIMIVGLDNSGKTSILNYLATSRGSPDNGNAARGSICSAENSSHIASTKAPKTSEFELSSSMCEIRPNKAASGHQATGPPEDANVMPTVGYNYERVQYKNLAITALDFSGQNRYRNLWQEFYNGVDAIVFVIDSSDLIRFVVARDELETMLSHPYFNSLGANKMDSQQHSALGASSMAPSKHDMVQKQLHISHGKLIETPLDSGSINRGYKIAGRRAQSPSQSIGADSRRLRNRIPLLFLANKSDKPNSVDTEVIKKALNLNSLPQDKHPWFIQATSVTMNQGIAEAFDWLASQLLSS